MTDTARPIVRELAEDAIDWTLRPMPGPAPAADLEDRFVDAVVDADSYRRLAQAALHEIRRLTITNDRQRDRIHQLTDETHQLRIDLLSVEGVTA